MSLTWYNTFPSLVTAAFLLAKSAELCLIPTIKSLGTFQQTSMATRRRMSSFSQCFSVPRLLYSPWYVGKHTGSDKTSIYPYLLRIDLVSLVSFINQRIPRS